MKMERKIWDLIVKHFTDEITKSEEKELQEWVRADKENEGKLNQVEQLLRLSESSFETYTPNTEKEWEKLKAKIEMEITQPKVRPITPTKWWRMAAAVLLLIGVGFLLKTIFEKDEMYASVDVITKDSIMVFYLPDSSKIHLNKNSKFTYPEKLAGTDRTVTLSGEAFFEVAKNASKPFIVQAGNTETKVLGTSFNVKAYEDDEEVEVIVVTGKVEFSSAKGEIENKVILEVNNKGTFNKAKGFLKKEKNKSKEYKWWLKNVEKDIRRFIKKVGKEINKHKNKN